jgi:RNA polymerase sigma factor (sigma-70 family)
MALIRCVQTARVSQTVGTCSGRSYLREDEVSKFASFFRERFGRTAVLLVAMGASRADADDCVQEAMLLACKRWDTIGDPAAWVNTVAVRRYWRLVRRQQQEVSLDETVPEPDAGTGIFTEEQQHVLCLLRQLPAQQRNVAALFYDGMATEEIAELVGVSPATVRSHLRHARTTLRGLLESERVLRLIGIV